MQSPAWYVKRLRSMDTAEILWRLGYKFRELSEVIRIWTHTVPAAPLQGNPDDWHAESALLPADIQPAEQLPLAVLQRLRDEADAILDNRLSYFDLKDFDHGTPPNWQRDHSAGKEGALNQSFFVNYRDFPRVGDCKLVWEPNRHHQLVTLGRCYCATGDTVYAQKVIDLIMDWCAANPYGYGMNWRSPLELAIRLINWAWAIELIKPSGLFTGETKRKIYAEAYLHIRDISRKYSSGTSANNHLVGEAAGVFIATSYFRELDRYRILQSEAQQILEREIVAQSFEDGCTREHALGYQFFVYQFYLLSSLAGRAAESPFSDAFHSRLCSMVSFLQLLSDGGKDLPLFGDCDDGKVIELGEHPHNVNAVITTARLLMPGSDLPPVSGDISESAYWLFGDRALDAQPEAAPRLLNSVRFDDAQYYLLQHGREDGERVSLFMDCADLGYTSIAAHGHADALAVTLRLNGLSILVDPGTYDYFSHPHLRDYFRSTACHNTVEVDGEEQSVMDGPFLWSNHANSHCSVWKPDEQGGLIVAAHDGYERLEDPVRHQRSVHLDGPSRTIVIADELICTQSHQIKIHFHFAPECQVAMNDHTVMITREGLELELEVEEGLTASILNGSDNPVSGWFSGGYHQKTPTNTLVLSSSVTGNTTVTTKLSWKPCSTPDTSQ